MDRRAQAIAATLFALSAAFVIQRYGLSVVRASKPIVAEPTADVEGMEAGEPSASPRGSAPKASQADPSPASQLEPGALLRAVPKSAPRPQLSAISEAVKTSYASTIAAFELHGEEADYVTHDAQAQQDADRLQQVFSAVRSDLSPELASSFEAVVDRIVAAQLQLMAFAINRKNRGMPDSAQAEAEIADRKALQDDVAPLLERVKAVLNGATDSSQLTTE